MRKNLQEFETKLRRNSEKEVNEPATQQDIREQSQYLKGKRGGIVEHKLPNRQTRRRRDNSGKVLNNRKKTSGRVNNTVLNKMSYFSLRLAGYRMGVK